MNVKNVFLGISLMAATAIAVSGCDRGANQIEFAGQDTASPSQDVTPSDPSGSDTVTPEDTTTATDTDSGAQNDPFCPAGMTSNGTASNGNPYHCCKIDDPQACIIVDPVPGGKHIVDGINPVDVAVLEPVTPVDPVGPKHPLPPVGPGEAETCSYDPVVHHVVCVPSPHQDTFGTVKGL